MSKSTFKDNSVLEFPYKDPHLGVMLLIIMSLTYKINGVLPYIHVLLSTDTLISTLIGHILDSSLGLD